MKKLILLLLLGGFVLTSCQKDDLNSELNSVNQKAKTENADVSSDLPSNAFYCIEGASNNLWNVTISDSKYVGNYDAYCVDVNKFLSGGDGCEDEEPSTLFSSLDPSSLPGGAFENPDTFEGSINWLLNNIEVGVTQSTANGAFTTGDVQVAIWALIEGLDLEDLETSDPDYFNYILGEVSGEDLDRILELIDLASEQVDFVPGCDQFFGVILIPFDGKQPIIFPFPVECENDFGCETAFGYGTDNGSINTCFIDLEGYKFNRWGWSVELSEEGTYTFDIYAGAGQCDLNKGTLVGTAEVDFSGGDVSVDYNIANGFVMNEMHTYSGDEPVPSNPKNDKPTVAPGQYTNEGDVDGDGTVYVILHSVICGDN